MEERNVEKIELQGLTFAYAIEPDPCMGAPWLECDGHGPVSDWTSRDKQPGEWTLSSDRRSRLFYDAQEAQRIALRDNWGIDAEARAAWAQRSGREPTRKQVAAAAVRRDFDYLRRWCEDDWYYCILCVTLLDVDGNETEEQDYLGGVESDSADHIANCARELADGIAARIGDARELVTRVQIRA